MKRLILIAGVLVFVIGCAGDPTGRWAQQRVALTTTQDLLVTANGTGQFSDADLVKSSPYITAARTSLAKAEAYLPAGGPVFDMLLTFVEDVTKNLQALDTSKLPELTNGTNDTAGNGAGGTPAD